MIAAMSRRAFGFVSRLMLALLVLACLVVGLLGLVLPVIPGLVFLLFAALAAARLSPRLGRRLHAMPGFRSHLGSGSRLSRLGFADKCRYGFWMTLKVTVDGLRGGGRAISRLVERRANQRLPGSEH